MRRAGLFAGPALVALCGCAAPVPQYVDFSEAPRNFRPTDYDQVRAAWTRHQKIWQISEGTVIELWAVYKSWEFRQAYVERYASVYGLSEAERTALLDSQRDAAHQSIEFHVAVQTTNYKWNDLDKPNSAWRVSLIDGAGVELAPRRIEQLKLPQLYESQFFPNRTEFTQTYLVRFNRADVEAAGFSGPASGRITLRVASPLAKAQLTWQSR